MTRPKLLLLPLLILLSIASSGWGASIVAKVDTPGTSIKYKTGTLANKDDASGWTEGSDLEAALGAAGNAGTLYIANGTYVGTMLDSADGLDLTNNTQTIIGESEAGVILDGTGVNDHLLNMSPATAFTGSYFTAKSAVTGKSNLYFAGNGSITLNHVTSRDAVQGGATSWKDTGTVTLNDVTICNNGAVGLTVTGPTGTSWVINRLRAYGNVNEGVVAGTGTVTLNYPILYANERGVRAVTTTTINNGIVIGNNKENLYVSASTGAVTITANNTIFAIPGGPGPSGYDSVENASASATIVLNNCLTGYSSINRASRVLGAVTENNPLSSHQPRWKNARRPGILVITVDDAASYLHADALATKMDAYGWKLTWYFNSHRSADSIDTTQAMWDTAVSLNARGHDIGSHSKYHSNLTELDDANLTAEVCTIRDDYVAHGLPAPVSFAPPGTLRNETVRNKLASCGYTSSRSGASAGTTYSMSSFKPYDMYGYVIGNLVGLTTESPTEAEIRQRFAAYCEFLKFNGAVGVVYTHSPDVYVYSYNIPIEWWDYILDEAYKSGVMVMSAKDAAAYIVANAEASSGSGGDITYTRSETHLGDASDYRLKPGSPCINTGATLDAAYKLDFLGYDQDLYGSGWEIGAYSYLGPKLNGIPNGTLLKWNGVNIGNIKWGVSMFGVN
jgi:peptidoglycan/xylan/chitin deacetylase (PgdA/CDA1 family)